MELFRLFFLGACIGLILNILWVIYYQIPRMMRKIVDLEDKYRNLHNHTYYMYEDLLKLITKHMTESNARDS